jgi:hypothetical protein
MPVVLLSKSWYCPVCNYTLPQALDPFGVYFTQEFTVSCGAIELKGIPAGICPSCYAHPDSDQRQQVALVQGDSVSQSDTLIQTTTLQSADLDAMTVPAFDADNQPIMVDSGKTEQKLAIVNGQPAVVEEPIMVQEERSLTADEKQTMLTQANQSLDNLTSVTVQEVSS